MKILLISPPVEDFFFTPQRAYPLGILSIGTVLEEAGFSVKILNCVEDYTKTTLPFPKRFSYLKRYYQPNKSPFCLFSHYYRFGLTNSQISECVKNFAPDIVGISANFSAYFKSACETAKLVKDIDNRIIVAMGGRVPTARPDFVLSDKNVDFAVRGEAEYAFLKLCESIKQGKKNRAKGICYRTKGDKNIISKEIALIKDLNRLPVLNRKLINYRKYFFQGNVFTSLLASRGCLMKCGFCAIKEPFRYRKAEQIIKEIEDCYSLGIRHFNFEDDTMNLHPEFEVLLDAMIQKYEGKIKISFMSGLLRLNLNSIMREKLLKAGLTHIDLSIASATKKVREKMKRRETPRGVFELGNFMAKRDVPAAVHFIIGYPGQSFKDAVKDLHVIADEPVLLGPSIFYPVVESSVFDVLKEEYRIDERDYESFRSSAAFFDKSISRDRIFLTFYFSRIINFVKELAARYVIKDGDLRKFLKNKLKKISMKDDVVYPRAKYDKTILGMVALKRLLEENAIYRIAEDKNNDKIEYRLKKEEFVSKKDVITCLRGLKIKGRNGRMIYVSSHK
ncbi:MAG: radical SAM protein [Candidatus Omnitrophota bacterium]